jgi:ATP-dependent exoDNAse (exonuclease V) beta subunit
MLKSHAATLLREIPFAAAQSTSPDPLDAVMIRGRIDLLLPTPNGVAIIDYKTDRISPSAVDSRAQTYRAQIETYRTALERVARQTITAVYLVFLTPRIIWPQPLNAHAPAPPKSS